MTTYKEAMEIVELVNQRDRIDRAQGRLNKETLTIDLVNVSLYREIAAALEMTPLIIEGEDQEIADAKQLTALMHEHFFDQLAKKRNDIMTNLRDLGALDENGVLS